MNRRVAAVCVMAVLAGCASMAPRLQAPGPVQVGTLQLTAGERWNVLPNSWYSFLRKDAQIWTRDGDRLDRLLIIPAVPDGEPLFAESSKGIALPRFKADMLPDELTQLAESSLVKLFGEGSAVVKASRLRPMKFGERRGVTFELAATLTDGPAYRGLVGAFIADRQLSMLIFIAAEPYYYDRNRPAAESIIASLR